jgi:hypothetical protein
MRAISAGLATPSLALIWVKWLLTVLLLRCRMLAHSGSVWPSLSSLKTWNSRCVSWLNCCAAAAAVAVQQCRQHVGADEGIATRHLLDPLQQGIDVAALGDEAQRAGLECPFEQYLRIMHAIDQDGGPRVELTDATDGFDAAEAFHAEIHDHGVRTLGTVRGVGRLATADSGVSCVDLLPAEPPLPGSLAAARLVHAVRVVEAEHVLHRDDAERGDRGTGQADQMPVQVFVHRLSSTPR